MASNNDVQVLKPCPKCGSRNVTQEWTRYGVHIVEYVACWECGCRTKGHKTALAAIKEWNSKPRLFETFRYIPKGV